MYNLEDNTNGRSRRAFLVGLILPGRPGHVVDEHLDELEQLAESAGVEVAGRAIQARRTPDAATWIGGGKVEEIAATAKELKASHLLFDDDLTGSQVKNLEKASGLSIMDRSGLILEIFDQRARSRETRTQVELARLNYLLPRLTRQWTHLSRQGGGTGQRGGEGEKQLEQDRRLLRARIRRLKQDLEKIERTRETQRRGRGGAPVVALAGYTNAGKSTLFNRLTHAGTLAENRLFATLDAKLRRGVVDGHEAVVFADTVGFIRKLPHHLVSSFRSTLGGIAEADVVLHVIDRSHPLWQEQMEVAEEVMEELGVDRERVLNVFNKCDLLPADARPGGGVCVSALTGDGLGDLRAEVARRLSAPLSPAAAKLNDLAVPDLL
ncbi:MAG TPA: GTPase HflX [Thermoanaerobaculia bacterium]|nr:GTPase HflX [Thermoanaerobaculia bacterium]